MGNSAPKGPPLPSTIKNHFKAHDIKDCCEAVGEGLNVNAVDTSEPRPWNPIKTPTTADWLCQYKEDGQTFEQFWEKVQSSATSLSHSRNHARNVVYLLPTPDVVPATVDALVKLLSAYLHPLKVRSLPALTGWDAVLRKTYPITKKPHVNTAELPKLEGVKKALSEQNDLAALVLLSGLDLYTENKEDPTLELTLAKSDFLTRFACVNMARLHISFYGSGACLSAAAKKAHEKDMLTRALKITSHEILAVLGFSNCVYFNCNMNGAMPHEVDSRSPFLCPVDLRKFLELTAPTCTPPLLQDQLALQRYEAMKKEFTNLLDSRSINLSWIDGRISFLASKPARSRGDLKENKDESRDVNQDGQLVDLSKWVIGKTQPLEETYTMGKPIGTPGAFGQAFLVTHKQTGEIRVVKIVSKRKFPNDKHRADHFEQLRNEIAIMRKAKHANIIQFFMVFETPADISIVMECCRGGELFDRIQEIGHFSEQAASGILRQIIGGIKYLHDQRIAHCDLKPDNFLFLEKTPESPLKIIDFGMSKHLTRGAFLTRFRGTPYYVAPEVLAGKYSEHCDVWSFGVIMFVLLFGFPPFHGNDNDVIFAKIQKGFSPTTRPGYGAFFPDAIPCSDAAKDLIGKCLDMNTAKRPTATEVLEHKWFNGGATAAPIVDVVTKNLSNFMASTTFKMEVLAHMSDIMDRDELKNLGQIFAEIDVNGDGLVSPEELVNAFKKQGVTDEKLFSKVQAMMQQADADGDGNLSYDELLMASVQRKLAAKEERLWHAFCRFDTDSSGKISGAEVAQVLNLPLADAQAMIKEIDVDGDGQIDYEEFNKMMMAKETREYSAINVTPHRAAKDVKKPAGASVKVPVTSTAPAAAKTGAPTENKTRTPLQDTDSDLPDPQLVDLSKWVVGKTALLTDFYTINKPIGTPGAFGQAFLVKLNATGEERVVKIISKQKFQVDTERNEHFEQLRNEIVIMRKAKHPNIIQFFKVYESVAELSIVMEVCRGGELFDRIQELGRFSEQGASVVLRQIVQGIQYLHGQRIAHRDLKPDNFLFLDKSAGSPLKIIDFGMSKVVAKGTYLTKFRGTPYYVAPEVLRGRYSEHCDIWSFGVIMFVCIFGFPPFHGSDNDVIFEKIQQGFTPVTKKGYGAYFPESIPCSEAAKDLIARCLDMSIPKRPTASEVLEHPWFNGSASTKPTLDIVAKNLTTFVASNKFKVEVLGLMVDILNQGELKSLATMFREIDVNGDGRITPDELVNAFKKQGVDEQKVLSRVSALMTAADADGDGSLSYNELLLAVVQRKLLAKEERLWQAYCKFDRDMDGKLTAKEVAEVLQISLAEAQALIKEIDLNGDGVISYPEFNSMWMEKQEAGLASGVLKGKV
jgi:calcium-dependent protein kinase